MESKDNTANAGGSSSEGAGYKASSDSTVPLSFAGSTDPIPAKNWIWEIEKILVILHCMDEQKMLYTTFKLTGEAEMCWESVRMLEEQKPVPVGMTWRHFREVFFERYYPAYVRNINMEEFMSLTQGQLTVQQYAARFMEPSHFASFMIPDEARKAWKFKKGLKKEILK
ncbi:uncharacterized protein LOC131163490 [Malania oleifera]|uniref:uncharacterized protein LOC131163490 n=1 Tax=Malania oleifera TaxID=397392 RepID=UPI0025AE1CB8|nr:uncharacterized protein LOC131163490 [Malania oleifera]